MDNDHSDNYEQPLSSSSAEVTAPTEPHDEEMDDLEFVSHQEIMDSSLVVLAQPSKAKTIAKAMAIKTVETLLPYGIGFGALAATEGSAAAAEFAAAHVAAIEVSVGALVATVRLYFYVVSGAVAMGAIVGIGGGIFHGIHQVMLDREDGQPLKLDEEQQAALEAVVKLSTARLQDETDLEATVATMNEHSKHANVQVAGCLDLLHAIGNLNASKILESGVVEAIVEALETHWDDEQVLHKGSEALQSLLDACPELEVTTLKELGADLAIEKAREGLKDL